MGRKSDYNNVIYQQLQEIMGRLDSVEKEHKQEVTQLKEENGHIRILPGYRSDVTYGTNIKALAVSLYSEGIMSNDRIASFLNAASKGELELSEGSIYGFCRKFAKTCEKSISNLENRLLDKNVVATDATTVTVNGEQNYIRNFSTNINFICDRGCKFFCVFE